MGTLDKHLRKVAIPYYGQVMSYNRSEVSDQDVSVANNQGDLWPIVDGAYNSATDYMVRILRPQFAQILQAYLNISLTFDSTEPSPKFYVSAGSGYGTDGVTAVVPSNSYIKEAHFKITGQTPPFTATAGQPITAYKLNILPLIPQDGDTNYSPDSFVVGVHFLQVPVWTNFHLQKFFVTGSALVRP